MNAVPKTYMTAEEYLAWEELQETKHEYLNGMVYEVYAMAGAKDAHVTITLNVASLLKAHLRGTPCRTYIADMKLQADEDSAYFYPDVFVTCDPRDRISEYHKSYPKLIVEVLSPSTAGYDRGDKFAAYRKMPSLEEYVVIDPAKLTVDLFRKREDGLWVLYPSEGQNAVEFASIGLSASFADLFEDVQVEDAAALAQAGV
jgi:Uma2 family endonuclease